MMICVGIGSIAAIVGIYKWMAYCETDEYKSLVEVNV